MNLASSLPEVLFSRLTYPDWPLNSLQLPPFPGCRAGWALYSQEPSPMSPQNVQLPSTNPRWPPGAQTGQDWLSLQEEPAWSGEDSRRG